VGILLVAAPARAAETITGTSGTVTSLRVSGATTYRTVTRPAVTRTVTAAASSTPVLVTDLDRPPAGYRLTATEVRRIAAGDPRARAELDRHPRAIPYEYTKGPGQWQVSWFADTKPEKELLQVYVADATGQVSEAWTGYQVAWSMARGYAGAFGRRVNAWYLWLALCIVFVAPFVSFKRRPTLLHLDLLMLLGFSISLALFNHGEIGLSVPLLYPFLVYLLVRLTLLAFGRGIPREPLHTIVSARWLGVGIIFLLAFRIGLNVLNSNVIDVGYAGVIGADKLIHGVALYGHWPKDNLYGDTYGPVAYYLYVPFRLIFGWSGRWDGLPAAHAASIFFDLVTCAGLFALGRRIRDGRLGIVLAYVWLAYPFSLYAMNSNTNDSLVAALVVLALLSLQAPATRGVMTALAGLTKFAPFVLAPLMLRGDDARPPRSLRPAARPARAHRLRFTAGFAIALVLCALPVLAGGDTAAFWHDSIVYQADRPAPFSIWGLWGGLAIVQHALQGVVVALALAVYFLPRRRGPVQVAALAGALIIALQLTVTYWLYPYLVWFAPMVIVAVFASHPATRRDAPLRPHDRRLPAHGDPIPVSIETG